MDMESMMSGRAIVAHLEVFTALLAIAWFSAGERQQESPTLQAGRAVLPKSPMDQKTHCANVLTTEFT